MNNIQASFYIPRISIYITEKDIIHIFDIYHIGDVKRVDFVPLVQNDVRFHSAFVHCYSANPVVLNFIEENDGKNGFKLTVSLNEYWILLKNKKPIVETRLNIHQVVENARLLEEQVLKQAEIIIKQTELIDRIQETIYQMLDTIFDPHADKSSKAASYYNYMMDGRKFTEPILKEEDDSQKVVYDDCDTDYDYEYEYEEKLEKY